MAGHRSRNWCFTLNNYTEHDIDRLNEQNILNYTYITYGKEIGEQGTHHLQGYVEFKNAKDLKTLKKFNDRAHWEKRRGKQEQAITYCHKDGNIIEIGEKKDENQGKRTDLDNVKQDLKNGKRMAHIADTYNYQCIRFAEKWLTYNDSKRTTKPTVTWIYGSSGSGKTKLAYEKAGEEAYWKDTSKWWDGYDKQESVIIDDFRGSQMAFNELLRLLDRYAHRVEYKGGSKQFDSPNIYITSINHPSKAYGFLGRDEPLKQLLRRIDNIIEIPPLKTNTEVKTNTKINIDNYENNSESEPYIESDTDTEVAGNTKPRLTLKKRTKRKKATAKSCWSGNGVNPSLRSGLTPPFPASILLPN